MLVAYLEYVKHRGFHSCYIWACPPLKGDDYILYCHPEDQKTPKDDRLRQWYRDMLLLAQDRGIVVAQNNLFDEFFANPAKGPKDLPYFEGDYWVGEAENVIKVLDDEALGLRQGRTDKRQSASKKSKSKSKSKGGKSQKPKPALEEDGTRDPLMVRLGNNIEPMKDSFFVAYLQPKEVRDALWARYLNEQEMEEARKDPQHPKHQEAQGWRCPPDETEDDDETQESEFFDNRQAFLNLCQGNHYQYDTVRRAKHSSMMVLYHLYNPDAPKFLTNCSQCLKEIVTGRRHSCAACPDFHLCDACVAAAGPAPHAHPLQAVPVRAKEGAAGAKKAMTPEQREQRRRTIRLHMQLLLHTSGCRNAQCPSSNCHKMKELQKHLEHCPIKPQGGCPQCRKMFALLTFHSRMCRKTNCEVPRCAKLKENYRLLAQQQQEMDDRRRMAMNKSYRQRPDGAPGGPGGDASSSASGP